MAEGAVDIRISVRDCMSGDLARAKWATFWLEAAITCCDHYPCEEFLSQFSFEDAGPQNLKSKIENPKSEAEAQHG